MGGSSAWSRAGPFCVRGRGVLFLQAAELRAFPFHFAIPAARFCGRAPGADLAAAARGVAVTWRWPAAFPNSRIGGAFGRCSLVLQGPAAGRFLPRSLRLLRFHRRLDVTGAAAVQNTKHVLCRSLV